MNRVGMVALCVVGLVLLLAAFQGGMTGEARLWASVCGAGWLAVGCGMAVGEARRARKRES
ncbi:MAG: hypothetical protein JOY66_18690 [Acetobacteraceae bacterium]|nr:hypothetical protein [Acetobacteraceae bacterium]